MYIVREPTYMSNSNSSNKFCYTHSNTKWNRVRVACFSLCFYFNINDMYVETFVLKWRLTCKLWEDWNFGDLYWASCNSSNTVIPRLVMRNTWNLLLNRWNFRNLLFGSVIFVFCLLASLWWFNALSTLHGSVMPKCRCKIYNRLQFPGIRLSYLHWFQVLCAFLGNYIKRRAAI
jgi:hypothetical protein